MGWGGCCTELPIRKYSLACDIIIADLVGGTFRVVWDGCRRVACGHSSMPVLRRMTSMIVTARENLLDLLLEICSNVNLCTPVGTAP
jgi:hypothetical protein